MEVVILVLSLNKEGNFIYLVEEEMDKLEEEVNLKASLDIVQSPNKCRI